MFACLPNVRVCMCMCACLCVLEISMKPKSSCELKRKLSFPSVPPSPTPPNQPTNQPTNQPSHPLSTSLHDHHPLRALLTPSPPCPHTLSLSTACIILIFSAIPNISHQCEMLISPGFSHCCHGMLVFPRLLSVIPQKKCEGPLGQKTSRLKLALDAPLFAFLGTCSGP